MENINIENKKVLNVYAKLQKARKMLVERGLKKGGKNSFSKFSYFELSDFIGDVNTIFDELGLFSKVSVNDELATMLVINTENPQDYVTFSCKSAPLELKGAVPLQSIGGQLTYGRKYLYMLALEIAEVDIVDASNGGDVAEVKGKENKQEEKPSLKEEVQLLCREKSKEKRAAVNDIIKKYNNGSISVAKVENEESLKKIKEEVEKL